MSPTTVSPPPAAARRSVLVLGLVLLLGLALRSPTFARPLISDDETVYATVADAVRRGDVLYRDIVDHKPPAIYDVYAVSAKAFGPYDTRGVHVMVVFAALLCTLSLALAGERLWGAPRFGIAAALLYAVFSTTMLDYDALAANCELFLVSAQALAFLCLVAGGDGAWRRWRWAAWFGAGILGGVSTVFKYQGATFALVIVVAAFLEWRRGRSSWAAALGALVVSGAGYLVVPAAYVGRLWVAGGLASARYWFMFNFAYVSEGPTGWEAARRAVLRTLLIGGVGALLPYAFGLVGTWRTLREAWRPLSTVPSIEDLGDGGPAARQSALDGRLMAVAWLAGSAVALAAGARFFGHYYHHVLPALCLLAAGPLVRAWQERSRWRPAMVALAVGPAAAGVLSATVLRADVIARTDPEPDYSRVVAALDRASRPEDRVFVWGNSPQIYALAQRPLGTRFAFCNYLTGISPGTRTESGDDNADPNEVLDAWPMLFHDLDERRPRWFVDAAAAGWDGYAAFPISRYPALQRYVTLHYTLVARVDGVGLYERSPR